MLKLMLVIPRQVMQSLKVVSLFSDFGGDCNLNSKYSILIQMVLLSYTCSILYFDFRKEKDILYKKVV